MRRIVWTFGLIAGAMLSVMMLITLPFHEQIGYDKSLVIGYSTMVLSFLMVFFGVRSYRDNVGGGRVTFGQAFKVGLLITLIASVCYVATWELAYPRFAPDFTEKYATHMLDEAKKSGATDAQLAAKAEEMKKFKEMYQNPLVNSAMTFIEPLPVGLLFTLLAAGVLSRRRQVAEPATA